MAKTIQFDYNDKHYTLEYTRKTVELMEKQGFVVNDLQSRPMTIIPTLFAGAFLAHHKFIKKEDVDEIYASVGNKQDLLEKLVEMYNEPIETLIDNDNEGNLKWEASW